MKQAGKKIQEIGQAAYQILRTSAYGHPDAIPGKRLRLMVQAILLERGEGPVHERALRAGIAWVTTHKGYPIASATRPPWGYYVMRPEERKDLRRAMITRVAALVRRMRGVDSQLADRIFTLLSREGGQDFQADLFV